MRDELFTELLTSIKEGGTILRGEKDPSRTFRLDPIEIKHIRVGYKLTQEQFAALLGISIGTLRKYIQSGNSSSTCFMFFL